MIIHNGWIEIDGDHCAEHPEQELRATVFGVENTWHGTISFQIPGSSVVFKTEVDGKSLAAVKRKSTKLMSNILGYCEIAYRENT